MSSLNRSNQTRPVQKRSVLACFSGRVAVAVTIGWALVFVLTWVWASGAVAH